MGGQQVTIDSNTYRVRVLKGATINPADISATDKDAIGSEWNNLMLPIRDLAPSGFPVVHQQLYLCLQRIGN